MLHGSLYYETIFKHDNEIKVNWLENQRGLPKYLRAGAQMRGGRVAQPNIWSLRVKVYIFSLRCLLHLHVSVFLLPEESSQFISVEIPFSSPGYFLISRKVFFPKAEFSIWDYPASTFWKSRIMRQTPYLEILKDIPNESVGTRVVA